MRTLALGALVAAMIGLSVAATPAQSLAQPGQWATVKGRVVFDGTAPARTPIAVNQDVNHCVGDRKERGPLLTSEWQVAKDGGVRYVFVWLGPDTDKKGAKFAPEQIHPNKAKPPVKPLVIDQPCCEFEPHAAAAQAGQALEILNSSPVSHNVNGSSKANGTFNVALPSKQKHTILNLQGDTIPLNISCNVHPWMKGLVRVYDHGYFALTDENGNFEITDAPVGNLRLFVWHEAAGYMGGKAGRAGKVIELKPGTNDLGELKIGAVK